MGLKGDEPNDPETFFSSHLFSCRQIVLFSSCTGPPDFVFIVRGLVINKLWSCYNSSPEEQIKINGNGFDIDGQTGYIFFLILTQGGRIGVMDPNVQCSYDFTIK